MLDQFYSLYIIEFVPTQHIMCKDFMYYVMVEGAMGFYEAMLALLLVNCIINHTCRISL